MPGVYIAWPFCAQKCTFCNFASGVFPRDVPPRYLDALLRELDRTAWPWTPQTVYLGGGTPGAMDPDWLRRILDRVPGRPWREATIEAAPGALTPAQVDAWLAAGINRVSLGVQSFVEAEIRLSGRRHTAAGVARDVDLLRAHGLASINIDLIAGLAAQTADGWRQSLDWIERLGPPHVSVYMLEVDEDSRLGRELLQQGSRYGAASAPSEQQTIEFYLESVERLHALGLERYEISNFARPGAESLHNLKYWQLEPYLGFGADAHSCLAGRRWQNVESPADYAAAADPRLASVAARPAEERFFVGLRLLSGIEPTAEELSRHAEAIDRHCAGGLLEKAGPRLRLTARGVLLSNEVFKDFLDD